MDKNLLSGLLQCANSGSQQYELLRVDNKDLVFEERVKFNCFYCGKYNSSWKCPPKLPEIDYKKLFEEYDNLLIVYGKFSFDNSNYNVVRADSSVALHKTLLKMEKYLWENNRSEAISFIGGSCKLCKNGCGKEKCNNPYMARSPIEATGVNVVKTMSAYDVEVKFPPDEYIMRIGMLLW